MRVFYLIGPVARAVEKVRDGFDRAIYYLGAEERPNASDLRRDATRQE